MCVCVCVCVCENIHVSIWQYIYTTSLIRTGCNTRIIFMLSTAGLNFGFSSS